MKLLLQGHDERYTVEQSLLNLFPGELPVYEPILPGDDSWAVVTLREEDDCCHVTTELRWQGRQTSHREVLPLSGTEYAREGQRRHAVGACFFLAAQAVSGVRPPWGMLTGVRPDKPATAALAAGRTPEETRAWMERFYYVSPDRAALAVETASAALRASRRLERRDIAVYVGIPFCPTRCAYCSFVSQSVEKSFDLVPPYVEALVEEIHSGGGMARALNLRCRTFYMGGGTPTTLTAGQLDRVLTALEDAFDLQDCEELTVEAGRPDTITAEKLAVLKSHGITRISVNPQTMEDAVLRAIGRRHTAREIEHALDLAAAYGFPHVNMDLIASAAAVDDTTFTITATQKTNRVLAALVFPIIPDTTIGTSLPTGCGPYKVVSNDSGKVLELEANDSWWKRTPYLSKITVKGIQDPDTALTSMDVNLVDLVHTDSLTASGYKQPGSRDVYEVMTQEYEPAAGAAPAPADGAGPGGECGGRVHRAGPRHGKKPGAPGAALALRLDFFWCFWPLLRGK